jgi:photosystem I P700 chlorophyll a apoprotein A1
LFFRYINSRVWSVNGHLNKALSKGPKTTTWIWNLHSDAHDFDVQQGSQSLVARKVFSSNIAHLSLVFFWLGSMHLNGAYFSNYSAWLKDPKHSLPSAHNVWPLVGQDILNSDVGGYFQGIYITSGLFQLWRSEGLVTQVHLKYACAASLIGTIISCGGSYYHMHVKWSTVSFYKKFKSLSIHHSVVLFGLGSISWCGHQIHISVPLNRLLDSGIDPSQMPCPQDLLSLDLIRSETTQGLVLFGFGIGSSDYFQVV